MKVAPLLPGFPACFLACLLASPLTGCYRTSEQPILAGQEVRLTVLHTSDIHARILPYSQQPGAVDRGLGLCAELQPIGGAARMAHLLRRERARSDRVIHLDSGDCFQGAPIFNAFKGEVEMRVMGELKPDAVVIGNHEFDLGSINIAAQYGRFGHGLFPMLVANYLFTDPADPSRHNLGQLTRPYEILNVDGLKIAVIGMGNTSSMTSIAQGGNNLGITPLEPLEVLRTWVKTLQDQVDLIFVVSHLGLTARGTENLAEDTEIATGYELVLPRKEIPENQDPADAWEIIGEEPTGDVRVKIPGVRGIDAIFGGHLHIVLNPPKVLIDPDGRPVLLVHSGAFAKFFGRADFVVSVPREGEPRPFGAEIISHAYSLFPITNRIPKRDRNDVVSCKRSDAGDPLPSQEIEDANDDVGLETPCLDVFEADDLLRECGVADRCRLDHDSCSDTCREARRTCTSVRAPLDGRMLELLEPYVQTLYRNQDLNRAFAYATDRIGRFGLSGEDAPLGNLVADAMRLRNRIEAQFALTNTLGIRTTMEKGFVTVEEMFNIFPFENTITTLFLSGVEVQELFDYVTERSSERGCQTQAQISGISFTMDCAQALRNVAAPGCETSTDCEGTEFAASSNPSTPRCVAGRCYKSPAYDIRIEGEVLNPTESYKAAVNDFIGRGGSGFEVLRRNTTKIESTLSLRDALIDHLRATQEERGSGRICGSPNLVAPREGFASLVQAPYRRIKKSTTVSCASRPLGCSESTGRFVDCKEVGDEVHFYCIPHDFEDSECREIARGTLVFARTARDPNVSGPSCADRPEKSCPGQLHCCEGKQPNADGLIESTFYCMVPLCVDPPPTGRIRRIVQ